MSKKTISDPEEKKLNAKAAFGLDDDEDEKFDPKKQTSSSKTKNSETFKEIKKKCDKFEEAVSLSKQLDSNFLSKKEKKEIEDRELILLEIKKKMISKAQESIQEIDSLKSKESEIYSKKHSIDEEIAAINKKSSKLKKKIKDSFIEVEETEKLTADIHDKQLKKELDDRLDEIKKKLITKDSKLDSFEKDSKEKSKKKKELESLETEIKEKKKIAGKTLVSLKDLLASDAHKKVSDHRSFIMCSKLHEVAFNLKNVQSLDLLFMMDSTGSMGSYIAETKKIISKLATETKSSFPEAEIRLGMLAYRDISDSNRFEIFEFSKNITDFENFVGKLKATGGDDTPEDINGALQKVFEFKWESATKILFHIGDAPCHNKYYHNYNDTYPAGFSGDEKFISLFEKLLMEKILYVILNVNESMDLMIEKFREHFIELKKYFSPGVTPFHYRPLNSNPSRLYESLISSVRKSMSTEIHSSLSNPYGKDKFGKFTGEMSEVEEESESDCEESPPKWETMSEYYWIPQKGVNLISMEIPVNEELLQNNLEDYKTTSNVLSNQEIYQHFPKANQGSFNKTYFAKLNLKGSGIKKMMVKFPKRQPSNPKEYYEKQLKLNTICKHLASIYNHTLVEKIGIDKGISFVDEFVYNKDGNFGILEMFIEGEYKKYTNNATYIAIETDETTQKIVAFSHWSYEFSKGNLMATDLQGSQSLLTDPTLHTSNKLFKYYGDFGLEGFSKFFSVHRCNKICQKLGLKTDPKYGKFSYLNSASIKKKCKNIFCIEETNAEFCEKCKKELDKDHYLNKKCSNEKCKKNFQYKKKEYIFKAINEPIYCSECKVKASLKSFGKLI